MSDGKKIDWHTAKRLADKWAAIMLPACERLEIVGSIRRHKSFIGDIDILAIPRRESGLFSEDGPVLLWQVLSKAVERGELVPGLAGDKMRTYELVEQPGTKMGVFTATVESWGAQCVIRTGPAEFGHKAVTQRCRGGLLEDGLKQDGGYLWRLPSDGYGRGEGSLVRIDTPEEADFMRYLSCGYVEPDQRAKIVGA